MPLAINPLKTIRVVLKSDKGCEPEPAFYYRFMTYRELMEVNAFQENVQAADAKTLSKLIGETGKTLFDMLRHKLTGWENMGVGYDPAALEDVLTLTEAFELLALKSQQMPTVDDKKKLE